MPFRLLWRSNGQRILARVCIQRADAWEVCGIFYFESPKEWADFQASLQPDLFDVAPSPESEVTV